MILLPVGHEDTVVRRIPWISVSILVACVGLQIYSSFAHSSLEERAQSIATEMQSLTEDAVRAHHRAQAKARADARHDSLRSDTSMEPSAEAPEAEPEPEDSVGDFLWGDPTKFRTGKLTAPDDPRYLRYRELEAELHALKQRVPSIRFGYRPALDGVASMLSGMFAHGGWLHLLGNMWFLYLVGCNLEDRWGRAQFLAFYLVAGLASALVFTVLHRKSEIPLVGASGAVAGAMGAFMICFARTRIRIFYSFALFLLPRWGTFRAPAWAALVVWVGQEAAMSWSEAAGTTPVAHSAHVGGFAFGATVAYLLRRFGVDSQLDEASEHAAVAERTVFQEHPSFVSALDQRAQGRDDLAIESLTQLLSEAPDHLGAHEVLLDIGLAKRDLRCVDYGLPFVFERYRRNRDHAQLVQQFHALRRTLPDYGLTDKELLGVATAAMHVNDHALAIASVTELMTQHPKSGLVPRALWLAAQTQARAGASELQRATLERLARRFPAHACGALAREALGLATRSR